MREHGSRDFCLTSSVATDKVFLALVEFCPPCSRAMTADEEGDAKIQNNRPKIVRIGMSAKKSLYFE